MEQRGQAVKETVTTTRKRLEHDLERQLNDAWAVQLEPRLTKHRAVDVWIFNSEHRRVGKVKELGTEFGIDFFSDWGAFDHAEVPI